MAVLGILGRKKQQADVHSGEVSLLRVCVHPKPFHDRCTWRKTGLSEELQLVRASGICEQLSRRPAGMKALSVSTAKAQQLSSSGVRH